MLDILPINVNTSLTLCSRRRLAVADSIAPRNHHKLALPCFASSDSLVATHRRESGSAPRPAVGWALRGIVAPS